MTALLPSPACAPVNCRPRLKRFTTAIIPPRINIPTSAKSCNAMSDFSSQLGLSGTTLQRLGDAYEGYAAASGIALRQDQERSERDADWSEQELLIGSCYVLAAIYRSILHPRTSIPLFCSAPASYRRPDH